MLLIVNSVKKADEIIVDVDQATYEENELQDSDIDLTTEHLQMIEALSYGLASLLEGSPYDLNTVADFINQYKEVNSNDADDSGGAKSD